MQRARPETPFRQPGAVSTDEMKFQKMRSSVAEHRPHKAACTGSSPVASTNQYSVCSSAWSEHCVWDAGARSSNLRIPTISSTDYAE